MLYILAMLPILIILILMVIFHYGGQKAGPLGWLAGILIATLFFGLNWEVLWISQAKSFMLSLYVLLIIWPALLIYNLVNLFGGIKAMAGGLQRAIANRSLLVVLTAWAFSGMLEGVAGFGLPIAIVAPILAGMGVAPLSALAAVAVGHSWSVTFGGMGVIWQTLLAISNMEAALLIPPVSVILAFACLFCGLSSAHILGELKIWPQILIIAFIMGGTQFILAGAGLPQLGAFSAGLAGLAAGIIFGRNKEHRTALKEPRLITALVIYGSLAGALLLLNIPNPVTAFLNSVSWQASFPETFTNNGYISQAGRGQIFKPLVHPGTIMLLVYLAAAWILGRMKIGEKEIIKKTWLATWKIAAPATIGILSAIGLSSLMEHTGMTQLLADGMVILMQSAYPLASPFIGILGAFTTGSNNNSNVLFIPLQKSIAAILGISPAWLVASQTAGGALGSMISPAKMIIGASTVGFSGSEGEVLRRTLPYVLLIGLAIGLIVWLMVINS